MRAAAVMATAVLLAGCASDVSFSDRLAGRDRVRGDAEGVQVFGIGSRVDALPLAVGHCAKFGRAARFTGRIAGGHAFRCVPG